MSSAYKRSDQLARLVRRPHTGPETSFLVHVDRKTDHLIYRAMVEGLAGLDNVAFLPRHTLDLIDDGLLG